MLELARLTLPRFPYSRSQAGVPVEALGNWCRDQRDGSAQAAVGPARSAPSSSRLPVSGLEAENGRLREELASAKLDIEIRKATAYFAKGSR